MTRARLHRGVAEAREALRGDAWLAPIPSASLAFGSMAFSAWMLCSIAATPVTRGGIGPDFIVFWSASRALLSGAADLVYSPGAFHRFEQAVTGFRFGYVQPFVYPPHMLLVVRPLALLPFTASLAAWLVATGAMYALAVAAIHPGRLRGVLGALAFPPVAMNVLHGQNGFLTAALFGWALLVLPRRPVWAGIAFGLLTTKPQLGLLVPVALVAARQWRAIAAASVTATALCGAATLWLGSASWARWIDGMRWMGATLSGPRLLTELQSPFAAVRLAGSSMQAALAVHAVVAIAAAIAVARVWQREEDPSLKAALLLAATPLAVPYFYDYDAMILAPAFAFLARHASARGWLPWEPVAFLAVAPLLLLGKVVAVETGVLPGPFCAGLVFLLVLRRIRSAAPVRLAAIAPTA